MEHVILELDGITALDEFHNRTSAAFDFPSYYGRNKDAFWDCITEFVDPTSVSVQGVRSLSGELRKEVEAYIALLREYSQECDSFKVDVA